MVVDVAEVRAHVVGDQVVVPAREPVADVDQRGNRALDIDEAALEPVDPCGRLAVELLTEDLFLQRLELVLQGGHDRKVMIHDEVHQGVEDEGRPLGEQARRRLATRPHVGVGQRRGAVPHRDDVVWPDEDVGLAEVDGAVQTAGGAQHDEDPGAVVLELRPLVGDQRILDGQVVQPELLLDLAEQRGVGLVQADPDEAVGVLDHDVADLIDRDVRQLAAVRVRDGVHDGHRVEG